DHGGVVVSNRRGHARRELAFLPSRRKFAHPDRRLAACLDNLIRQPLELLAITRIERKRSQTIEHLRCPQASQLPPERASRGRWIARQLVRQQHPRRPLRGHQRTLTYICNRGCITRFERDGGQRADPVTVL